MKLEVAVQLGACIREVQEVGVGGAPGEAAPEHEEEAGVEGSEEAEFEVEKPEEEVKELKHGGGVGPAEEGGVEGTT